MDVVSDGVDDAYMRDLMVHPEHQDRDIASNLVAMVAEVIKRDGIKLLSVLFEPEAADFYRKAGFYIMAGGEIDFER